MIDGFLNILKPPAMSSHDVIAALRRILGVKRIGHAGTLDPAAAGVLPVAVGKATRLLEYLPEDKAYRAEVRLGIATDSGDATGQIIARQENIALPSAEVLQNVLREFVGTIKQKPPAKSAVKIDGRRAYKLTRKTGNSESIAIPVREVKISAIVLSAIGNGGFVMDVACGKGTYIRSLVTDIGEKLGTPAVLNFLVRTLSGGFSLSRAITLDEVAAAKDDGETAKIMIEPSAALSHIPRFNLPPTRAKAFADGMSTTVRKSLPPTVMVFSDGKFLGIGRFDAEQGAVCPVKTFDGR